MMMTTVISLILTKLKSLILSSDNQQMNRRDLLLTGAGFIATTTVVPSLVQAAPTGKIVTLDKDLRGYYAAPKSRQPAPAIMVLMEAFGLNDNIKSVCDRLAQAGYLTLSKFT
jgi:hypothetical protein